MNWLKEDEMTRKELFFLFLLSFGFTFTIGLFQASPGYMDADYYYAGGMQLYQGQGFSDNFLWNYLDNPQTLPHPSHGYWYPLASILAAIGMAIGGSTGFSSAKILFILIGGLIGPLVSLCAFQISGSRAKAWLAGLLGVFSGFYSPYISTTDNYGILIVLGASLYLLLTGNHRFKYLWIGLVIGLMNLARSDSLLWLGLLILKYGWDGWKQKQAVVFLRPTIWLMLGYTVVMGPWLARNVMVFGSPLSAAGGKVLWATTYHDTFAWPPARLTIQSFLATGWGAIYHSRISALGTLAINAVMAQIGILNLGWFLAGVRELWKKDWIRFYLVAWFLLWIFLSILFPYAAVRGSFFHASSVVFPVLVIIIVEGVWKLFSGIRIANKFLFSTLLAILFSIFLIHQSVTTQDWDRFYRIYSEVEKTLARNGATKGEVIMVTNPPGYTAFTSRPAIVIPEEVPVTILELANKFNANYIIIDQQHCRVVHTELCDPAKTPNWMILLNEIENTRVYRIIKPDVN